MKLKSFNTAKEIILYHLDKAAGHRMRKDFFTNYTSSREFVSKIYKKLKKNQHQLKMGNRLRKQFSNNEIEMTEKC